MKKTMKIVMRELQLPATVIMIYKNMNYLNREKNRVKHGPMGKKEGEDNRLFFSLVSPVRLEEIFSF